MGLLDAILDWFSRGRVNIARRFEIGDKVASTEFGEIHQVQDKKKGGLKWLKRFDSSKYQDYWRRFTDERLEPPPHEIDVLSHFGHPNILQVIEAGEFTNQEPFILLEVLEGMTLSRLATTFPSRLDGHRLDILRQAASALQSLHDAGYLHRDICPDVFWVASEGDKVKLTDFSLAVPRKAEYITPAVRYMKGDYMAPETIRRQFTDVKLDMYAFGVTAYQIFAGKLPWGADGAPTTIARQLRTPVDIKRVLPTLNTKIARAIMSCLLSDPNDRCASMNDFVKQIEGVKD